MADRISYSSRRNQNRSNLSFTLTLLDEICRSIDRGGDEISGCRESMRMKRDDATARFLVKTEEEIANYERASMIEKWMEKKVVGREKSFAELQYSSSISSDSSCGGGGGFFSSSEAESLPVWRPKPVRTGKLGFEKEMAKNSDDSRLNHRNRRGFSDGSEKKAKDESRFVKKKSKALKIYGDLKKVKQPISPGGKVAAFLNSLFAAGNLKKPKVLAAACGDESPSVKSTTTTTTCSPASSFSRSCLSKATPPSSAKSGGSATRSVTFYPLSVILDEDCRKSLHQKISNMENDVDLIESAIDEELLMHVMENNRRLAGEASGDFPMHDQKKDYEFENSSDFFSKIRDENRGFDHEFEDEFDGASCASSDLFELENLSAIGMEELPVYDTTQLEKIQTVANGLIL